MSELSPPLNLTPTAVSGEKEPTGGTCRQGLNTTTCRCCSPRSLSQHLLLSVASDRLPNPQLATGGGDSKGTLEVSLARPLGVCAPPPFWVLAGFLI